MSVRLDPGEDTLNEVHKINLTLFIEPAKPAGDVGSLA